ncbi:hypothetical protein DFH09DRAFT_1408371 [Mycena vulgaris]|nr:hypothetical protein DFH09DRAFT_1408371 [Mycena vulgaris]
MMPSDWERPMVYLHRIKVLVYRFDSHFYRTLRMFFPHDFLCPNLPALTWDPESSEAFPLIFMFLGPQITRITVGMDGSLSCLSILPTLGVIYPHLLHVTVYTNDWEGHDWEGDEQQLVQCIAAFVTKLTRLTSLSLPNLNRETFEHIARLPDLTSLVLEKPIGFIPGRPSDDVDDELGFPRLKYLRINAASTEFTIALIRTMKRTPLSSLSITFTPLPNTTYLPEFYSALAAHCHIWRSRLFMSSLTLAGTYKSRIQDLELVAPSYRDRLPKARVTLTALSAFAVNCLHLKFLHIILDASAIPATETHLPSPQNSLTYLDVGYSPISPAPAVANFLRRLFSRLTKIYTDHDAGRYPKPSVRSLRHSEADHCIWKEVKAILATNAHDTGDWESSDD